MYRLTIRANEGYRAEQAIDRNQSMTVGDLLAMLEGLDEDAEIVTKDLNNERGASFGVIIDVEENYEDED